MTEIEFRSGFTVELVESMGTDMSFVQAAKVSTLNDARGEERDTDEGLKRLHPFERPEAEAKDQLDVYRFLNFLMKNRHHSPFEMGAMKFRIEAPIVVAREFFRHRVASYNEMSGRYTEMLPVFYVPDPAVRPLAQKGKPGAYEYTMEENVALGRRMEASVVYVAEQAWDEYQGMLDLGVAKEVARMVLPVNVYTQWYVMMNPRALMNFLSLRTEQVPGLSVVPSFPMWEIARVAEQMEELFKGEFPVTWKVWNENGREGA